MGFLISFLISVALTISGVALIDSGSMLGAFILLIATLPAFSYILSNERVKRKVEEVAIVEEESK